MTKKMLLLLLVSISSTVVFGQINYERISSKTWQEDNDFAGATIVFVKTDKGQIIAFKQINGSGLSVIATEIYNVDIKQDTIFILTSLQKQQTPDSENIIYTYVVNQGLFRNGRQLKVLLTEPKIQLFTLDNKLVGTSINVNKITGYEFEGNKVYINEKSFMLAPIHN